MISLNGTKVTVMGLGLHGGAVGTVRWLCEQGALVTVTDMKSEVELAGSLGQLKGLTDIEFVLGEHRAKDFRGVDLVVRNPAVRRDSEYLKIANSASVPVEMDSSLFWQACPANNIIGVTGSKGKTTAAKSIMRLLSEDGLRKNVVEVGTDGISPLAQLKNIDTDTTVIFELSSWRLEALDEHKMSPPVAIVTSLYRDHLNSYKSYEEYIETKKTIMRHQGADDQVILNADDKRLTDWEAEVPGQVIWFSLGELPVGDGIGVKNNQIFVRVNGNETVLYSLDTIGLKHEHERRNVLPAIWLAHVANIKSEKTQELLQNLKPLPHRMQVVGQIDGVSYINDSSATMPDATIAALKSLKGNSIVHIIGGNDKDLIFDELAHEEAQATIRALIFLPGTANEKIKAVFKTVFEDNMPPVHEAESMRLAVDLAKSEAKTGDIVLLSPGATSFAIFKHEIDRGNQFINFVRNDDE